MQLLKLTKTKMDLFERMNLFFIIHWLFLLKLTCYTLPRAQLSNECISNALILPTQIRQVTLADW